MNSLLPLAQIITAVLLIASILLQQRGTALGGALGGEQGFYTARRGIQKKLFWLTIILAGLFIFLAVLNLLI